jgi:heme/copper-type cytochrome/quinol oxidase subunit 2
VKSATVLIAIVGLAIALLPESAIACSVCWAGAEESRKAFLFTTILLSVLPLGMIGAFAWIVWRSVQDGERAERAPEREAAHHPAPIRNA